MRAAGEEGAGAEDFLDLAEFAGVGVLRKIDDVADEGAGLEGDADFGAEDDLRVERGGDGVVEGAVEGDFGDDSGDAHGD